MGNITTDTGTSTSNGKNYQSRIREKTQTILRHSYLEKMLIYKEFVKQRI